MFVRQCMSVLNIRHHCPWYWCQAIQQFWDFSFPLLVFVSALFLLYFLIVSGSCLAPTWILLLLYKEDTSYIRWEDDDVRFVFDQHAELDLKRAISLKITVCCYIHVCHISNSQPLILNDVCIGEKQQILIS